MKKFKKAMALSLSLAMGLSLAACGSSSDSTTAAEETTTAATSEASDTTATTEAASDTDTASETEAAAAPEETTGNGEKVYVYSWNSELGGILDNFLFKDYPELKDVVEYENLNQGGTSSEYLTGVTNSMSGDKPASIVAADNDEFKTLEVQDFAAPLSSIGFDDSWYNGAFQYTIDFAKNEDGKLMGTAWQATPGVFVYRTDIAEKAGLGSTPEEVQENVKDWDAFEASAKKVKDAGYYMLSSVNDLERPWLDQRDSAWVVDGALNIDPAVNEYLELTKKYYDAGYFKETQQWTDDWNASMSEDVLGFFGCPWFVTWTLAGNISGTDAFGKYNVIAGPKLDKAWHWGGTYLMTTNKVANPETTAFVIWYLTCNEDFLKRSTTDPSTLNFPNNEKVAQDLADSGDGAIDALGGQNPVQTYIDNVDGIDLSLATNYDTTLNGILEGARDNYDTGELSSVDDVIAEIKTQTQDQITDVTVE